LSEAKYIFLFFGSSIKYKVRLSYGLIQIFDQILNVLNANA
jgi:hypothetical protein